MPNLNLLLPLDGTDFSRKILPQVRKLFTPERWRLSLLHVARLPIDPSTAAYGPAAVGADYRLYLYGVEYPAAELHPVYDEERLEDFRDSLEADLQEEVELFRGEGYEVEASVHFGNPRDEIVEFATEKGVDVVAMATHGRKGLDRLLHGSVANQVLDKLTIPTLLLRVEEEEDGE